MANILVVDDSIIMRKNLKTILTQGGHTVVGEASNGQQAYNEFVKLNPDLVTMDITMPVMDGIHSVQKILGTYPEAKIVMISALDQKNMVFEALENGAKHYIMKPITPEKVLSIVNEVLFYNRIDSYAEELNTKDEVLDTMWVEIKDSKDEIVEIKKSQEKIVEERTSDLEMANRKLKQALSELQNTEEKLIQSEKSSALTGMVAGVAHEINTPVGISITAISFLQEKSTELSELYYQGKMKKSEFEKYLSMVSETTSSVLINLKKASDLIRSFKQVAVDQSTEEKRTFNIKDYLNDVILSLKPELKRRDYAITINCEDSLEIYSYPGSFSQIITNFVMNSLIHGYELEDKVNLTINIVKSDSKLIFEYCDDGNGMTDEVKEKIFDPFFTTKRGNGGTGLGLNIVYNIVTQKLGGTIKCESGIGVGTQFIISIPL